MNADQSDVGRGYVTAIITNYLRLPGTPLRASRKDRRLAAELHERGVPLRVVYTAFVLAGVRHSYRSPDQQTLSPIRTLSYFLGAIDEVLHSDPPLDPAYVADLAEKLQPRVAKKEALLRSRSEPIKPSLATRGQKSAFPRGR